MSSLMVMLRLLNVKMAKTALAAEADIVPAYAQPRESFVSRVIRVSCRSILRIAKLVSIHVAIDALQQATS